MASDKERLIAEWHKAFKQATDHDLWGQPLEARASYKRLSVDLTSQASEECTDFTDEQKRILGKIATCLDLRSLQLQKPGNMQSISLEDLKKIGQIFDQLLSMKSKDFPVDVSAAQVWAHTMNSIATVQRESDRDLHRHVCSVRLTVDFVPGKNRQKISVIMCVCAWHKDYDGECLEEEQHRIRARGSLLPKPLPIGGKHVLTIFINKVGLKDASQYLDPFITVSVKDELGVDLTAEQDTPVSCKKEDQYVIFNVPVHLQKPIDILPPGYAIFFEFKHYKPRKKIMSTKCWSFMERDEIKDGETAVELYKKPADFRRKSLTLLTVKPLYLHLKLSIST